MRNIALKLMYNGMAYHGWQMQRTEASVQETLQRGLSMVCGERVRLTGVGRTDAGVHAERYVANFRTSSRIPIDRLPFAVNTHTPEDIVVREALEVADDFNAIGSCLKKEYTYRIYNSRIKNPFYVNRAYFYPKKLDEAVMDAAARAFEGTHDFRAVRSDGNEDHRPHRALLPRDAPRRASGAQGLRGRLSLQHGARHHRHGALRRRGQAHGGGHSQNTRLRRPHARRPHGAAGGTVHDQTLV